MANHDDFDALVFRVVILLLAMLAGFCLLGAGIGFVLAWLVSGDGEVWAALGALLGAVGFSLVIVGD